MGIAVKRRMAVGGTARAAGMTPAACVITNALLLITAGAALAQVPPPPQPPAAAAPKEHETQEGPESFEADFAASNIFRAGSYIQPLWHGLEFEGHYFGGKTTDTGFTGGAWRFRIGELKLSPGFGVMFGSNQFATSPATSFRWDYERGWLVTQGLFVRGFRKTPVFAEHEHSTAPEEPVSYVQPKISDGNHLSARWKRVDLGGTFEHIQFREGNEWKGGGRLAIRLLPRVSALFYVLGPGKAEWRFGVLIHRPGHE